MDSDDAKSNQLATVSLAVNLPAPRLIETAGPRAKKRFFEFFTATIRNQNTRQAYARALSDFFAWCDDHDFDLLAIEPIVVAAYIEYLGTIYSSPTVKQHLAAIRMCFDWLVVGQILPTNPASAVRGPKHVVKRGKTPVLSAEEARQLLDSIDCSTTLGLRDRALIALMIFSFARVSAVLRMNIEDYYHLGKRGYIRLHEKGGKFHEVPAHHKAEEFLDAYIAAAGNEADATGPLFRTAAGRSGEITSNRMSRQDAARMVKRRARQAGLSERISCHTFRATGITAYLENGGTIENAQAIAAHESPRTTKLYDRTSDELTLDEIERILI
ncbi:tyrosine-type recombinase/integrase [Aeoliella sp.]|uniref:tyrosine-type recombinase/integrase n=1 Tax=Aeoliella sp. TaxID=2795800 RepID=UPI003CCC459E